MIAPNPSVLVTITSDLVCPWCWVGLRKLQAASEVAKIDVDIVWKPFFLRPDTPQEGSPKGGTTPDSRVPQRLKEAGKLVGIDFTGLTDTTPNTLDFHATMKYLLDSKVNQTPFQEAVFDGYFTKGVFPDHQGMMESSKQLEEQEVSDHVKTFLLGSQDLLQKYRQQVAEEAREASRRGVHGVPSFAFNGGQEAISGAQDVETFVKFLKQHAATTTATTD
jgi:predicted DsbA family dithiol-disulfide isomerase